MSNKAGSAQAMTAQERKASLGLALIFALRMLGLFLVVPVFELEARHYSGGMLVAANGVLQPNAAAIGLAMGVYGLTQALLQLPLGMASDRFGRKRLIVLGLLVFAAGSATAALASSLEMLIVGRALQGAGAISAAVTALLADLTRDVVRTKAMALIGASIGLVFALALVASPLLNAYMGLSGMFWLVGVLALLAVAVVLAVVPPEPARHVGSAVQGSLRAVMRNGALLRLNVGVFVLHAVQLAMWMVLPGMLVAAGLAKPHHWWLYLPAVLGSFVVMGGVLFRMERRGRLKAVFLVCIALVALVQAALWMHSRSAQAPHLAWLGVWLLVFFSAFNMLEAAQPSLVSRMAPQGARGMALGVYNTAQSLGLFAGGAVGGLAMRHWGGGAVFAGALVLVLLWLALSWSLRLPAALHDAHG